MSKLVLYYSLTGNAAKAAQAFSKSEGSDISEVKPAGKIGKFKAYTLGCFKAIRGKSMAIAPLDIRTEEYDEVDVFTPIWADSIAPPMLAALEQLPKGTKVRLHLVSASGNSGREKNSAKLESLGLKVAGYQDIK